MKRPLTYLVFIVVLTSGYFAQGQQSFRAYRALADSLYKYHNYQDAAEYYERAVRLAPDSTGLMLRIARAYAEMNNVNVSEGWYARAIAGHAAFNAQDTYDYVKDLLKLERREDARKTLRAWLEKHPADQYARSLLEGVVGVTRYLRDSTAYVLTPLAAVNTPASEFAPAYYSSGLLFTTARSEGRMKRKYHWDRSPFLSLYFAEGGPDQPWKAPVPFGREIHSEFHDGPAVVFGGDQRMILNRNVQRKFHGANDIYISHLALVEAALDPARKSWSIVGQLLTDSTYSYAHPFMTEDGNRLFFASDKPGGYGGSDIYMAIRHDGQWQKPVNAGALVNSPESETFPYYVDHTLYFASDGHTGFGGLDIFRSPETPYGFGLPENLGYPLNSHRDDFALITRDHQQGYLSSSRSGNDDLYAYKRQPKAIKLLARLYDGKTQASLSGGQIEILTDSRDQALVSGNGGYAAFELPEASAYMLVARYEDRVGVLSGLADVEEDRDHRVQEVALLADTTHVVCVGTVKDKAGLPADAGSVQVVDEATGEVLKSTVARSMISFAGQRGHRYRVTLTGSFGNVSTHTVDIQPVEKGLKTWSLTLGDTPATVRLRVHVADAESRRLLGGARVMVTTVMAPEQELTADASGQIELPLPAKAAYMIVASQDDRAGMQYGFAELQPGQDQVTDTVYVNGGAPVHGLIVVTNEYGGVLDNAVVTIRDDQTGETKTYPARDGALGFSTQPHRSYTIKVERQGYTTTEKKLVTSGLALEKIPVMLQPASPAAQQVAIRVTHQNNPVADAQVKIMTFMNDDTGLHTPADGVVEFDVPKGEGYIVTAEKQGAAAMYAGVSEQDQGQPPVVHVLELGAPAADSLYLYGFVTNHQGKPLPDAEATVVNTVTSELLKVQVRNGMLALPVRTGGSYEVRVSARDYAEERLVVSGDAVQRRTPLPTVRLKKRMPVTIAIADPGGQAVADARVIVKDVATGEEVPASFTAGTLSFAGEQGRQYRVSVAHDQYHPVTEDVVLPRLSDTVLPRAVVLNPLNNTAAPHGLATRVLMAADSLPVADAAVKIISLDADDLEVASDAFGAVRFQLPEGTSYIVMASKGDYAGMYAGFADGTSEGSVVMLDKTPKNRVMVITRVTDEQRQPVAGAEAIIVDKNTGEKVPVRVENGFLAFYGRKGGDYEIAIQAPGYKPASAVLHIKPSDDAVDPLGISLQKQQTPELQESLRVVLASNNTSLPHTAVKVISLLADDQELSTGDDGLVRFRLPEGSAYMALAQQGNFYGVYSGEITPQSTEIRTLVLNDTLSDRVPVIGLMKDGQQPVVPTAVVVTDVSDGTPVPVQVNQGMLMFLGKKGSEYTIEVTSGQYETQVEKLRISPQANGAQELEIAFTRRQLLVLPDGASLVVIRNEVPRLYIVGTDTHDEIVEEDGNLFLVRTSGKQLLGKGRLRDLSNDPMRSIGMKPEQLEELENIYFDFNSTALDSADRTILKKSLRLLNRYPLLQLAVNTHADTRGSSRYNLNLTRRRARAVKHYLTHNGIRSRRVDAKAYGKSTPAVICATPECSEQQHQKNRRAEFEMPASRRQLLQPMAVTKAPATVMKPTAKPRVSASYAALLARYGAREKDGLVFKVCVGAYRLNPTLTFPDLKDLGEVHRQEADGIHYYYVQGYSTLQAAETVRQQVMLRGTTDAYIAVFYQDQKISFNRFIALTE